RSGCFLRRGLALSGEDRICLGRLLKYFSLPCELGDGFASLSSMIFLLHGGGSVPAAVERRQVTVFSSNTGAWLPVAAVQPPLYIGRTWSQSGSARGCGSFLMFMEVKCPTYASTTWWQRLRPDHLGRHG